jgi:hypothetical protein
MRYLEDAACPIYTTIVVIEARGIQRLLEKPTGSGKSSFTAFDSTLTATMTLPLTLRSGYVKADKSFPGC